MMELQLPAVITGHFDHIDVILDGMPGMGPYVPDNCVVRLQQGGKVRCKRIKKTAKTVSRLAFDEFDVEVDNVPFKMEFFSGDTPYPTINPLRIPEWLMSETSLLGGLPVPTVALSLVSPKLHATIKQGVDAWAEEKFSREAIVFITECLNCRWRNGALSLLERLEVARIAEKYDMEYVRVNIKRLLSCYGEARDLVTMDDYAKNWKSPFIATILHDVLADITVAKREDVDLDDDKVQMAILRVVAGYDKAAVQESDSLVTTKKRKSV